MPESNSSQVTQFDIAIIGSGALALSTSVWLHRLAPDYLVARVAPPRGDGCASSAAGAMLGTFGELTANDSPQHHARLQDARAADELWPDWLDHLAQASTAAKRVALRRGTIIIAHGAPNGTELRILEAIRSALVEHHEPFEELDTSKLPHFDPKASRAGEPRALHLPREAFVDAPKVLDALDRYLEQSHKQLLIPTSALRVCPISRNKFKVEFSDRPPLLANQVLIAAGAYSQRLISSLPELAKIAPQIRAGVGCALVLEAPFPFSQVMRTPNDTGGGSLHLVPLGANRLYLGATYELQPEPSHNAEPRCANWLLETAAMRFHRAIKDFRVVEFRVGNRPVTGTTLPLVGSTSIPGLYLATATNRTGFHLAPLLGQRVAKAILGQASHVAICSEPPRLDTQPTPSNGI